MKKNTFVGFGELLVDKIYDEKGNLLKQDGGDTTWNILHHLGLMGEKCYAMGVVGNDENTPIAIDSLARANVNTDNIVIQNKNTNVMNATLKTVNNVNSISFSKNSPIDGKLTFKKSQDIPTDLPENLKDEDLIIVLLNLDEPNLKFIDNIENKKVALDLGHLEHFENFDSQYILNFLRRVNVCQINGNVVQTLCEKLNVSSEKELYELINPELLVITYGKDGARFFYKEEEKTKEIQKSPLRTVENPIDTAGAGDAFLSVILYSYNRFLSGGEKINKNFIDNTFALANLYSCQIVQQLGCRGTEETLSNWLADYNQLSQKQVETVPEAR